MTLNSVEKQRLVERAAWEGVSAKDDNHVIIEGRWVQQTTPGTPVPFLNGVYRCEIDDSSITARIKETIEHYDKLKISFRWKVTPSNRPANLKTLLVEHGMFLKETLFGFIALPGQIKIPQNPEVKIEAVTIENLEDWLMVQVTAWKVPPPGISYLRRDMSQALASGNSPFLNFIAYRNGLPVASAGFSPKSDYALLMGAAVNPEMRGKGIYKTLLSHRLKIIEQHGLPAVIHCLENTSAPICVKLGFEKVCEILSFERNPT